MRWPLNTYRNRDAGKMSEALLAQLAIAEAMTLEDYRAQLAERAQMRAVYANLAAECDAALTLAATGAAPEGLGSTGNGIFGVPGSLLGVPAVSLPLLQAERLPLGLQMVGFAECDAALFATAAWLMEQLRKSTRMRLETPPTSVVRVLSARSFDTSSSTCSESLRLRTAALLIASTFAIIAGRTPQQQPDTVDKQPFHINGAALWQRRKAARAALVSFAAAPRRGLSALSPT